MRIKTKYSIGQQIERKKDGLLLRIDDIAISSLAQKPPSVMYYTSDGFWWTLKNLKELYFIHDFIIKR